MSLQFRGREGTSVGGRYTALILAEFSGSSLAWGEVTLPTPVTSSTGIVHAVFELPVGLERTGTGTGTGPGIGYTSNAGPGRAYLSPDGVEWIQLREDFALAVEPVVVRAKAGPSASLASLRREVEEGWWSQPRVGHRTEDEVGPEEADKQSQVVSASRPLAAAPNPFKPRVNIHLYSSKAGAATVEVFDLRGRRVARLLEEPIAAGQQSLVWNGVDEGNRVVASGVYFIRATTPDGSHTMRVALVR